MKIIGKTHGGFILEATENEVANLCGYHSAYQTPPPKPEIGFGIPVAGMYSQLYRLADHRRQVADLQDKLRNMADNLEPVKPFLESIAPAEGGDA